MKIEIMKRDFLSLSVHTLTHTHFSIVKIYKTAERSKRRSKVRLTPLDGTVQKCVQYDFPNALQITVSNIQIEKKYRLLGLGNTDFLG